jgi:hypothetical protein
VEGHEPQRPQAAGVRGLALIVLAAVVVGCGGDGEDAGKPKLETTDAGTRIIGVTDEKAGLEIEIQNDSLFATPTDDAPESTKEVEGELIGASCRDDGRQGVEASPQFPVYWREKSGDWGSALARQDDYDRTDESRPVLAEHVTRCELFKTEPTGEPDQVVFDAENDTPLATAVFR